MAQPTRSLTSTNFWFSIISLATISLSILGIDINPEELEALIPAIQSKQLTAILIALVGAGMSLYNIFKNAKLNGGIKELFNNRNWWTGVITAAAGAFMTFSSGGFPEDQAEQVVDAVRSGNFVLIVTAGWTFIQTLYFMFIKKDTEETSV